MSVRLVSYSQPAGDNMTLQDMVCYCARVSNPSNQMNTENNERLINYLIKNYHWSPFEMVNICLEITTTRDIARQILRHRSFSFQEFSQRYAVVRNIPPELREARTQDLNNRQNSITTDDNEIKIKWMDIQKTIYDIANDAYNEALDMGIAKEQARAVLPEGLTPSTLYMNGSLRSWIHYIQLRSGHGTQKEHKLIARACADAIAPLFSQIVNFIDDDMELEK